MNFSIILKLNKSNFLNLDKNASRVEFRTNDLENSQDLFILLALLLGKR